MNIHRRRTPAPGPQALGLCLRRPLWPAGRSKRPCEAKRSTQSPCPQCWGRSFTPPFSLRSSLTCPRRPGLGQGRVASAERIHHFRNVWQIAHEIPRRPDHLPAHTDDKPERPGDLPFTNELGRFPCRDVDRRPAFRLLPRCLRRVVPVCSSGRFRHPALWQYHGKH